MLSWPILIYIIPKIMLVYYAQPYVVTVDYHKPSWLVTFFVYTKLLIMHTHTLIMFIFVITL